VRLSSIEVNHLTDRLLEAMSASPAISPHLHVPMQSGADRVLRSMARRYTQSSFLSKLTRARELVSGLNLTTDVIVGHPAEDAGAFSETLQAVRAAGFSKVHVFPYSPRPGTADAAHDPVSAGDKRARSAALRRLSEAQGEAHRRRKLGRPDRVLVEDENGRGYGADYTPYRVPGAPAGRLVDVVARALEPGRVLATMRS
jgi:threonylcarbamoyladenosine tRNA methylthiotransferase MtaB